MMKKEKALLFHSVGKVHTGEVLSGVGFLVYLIGSGVKLPDAVLCVPLVIFSAAAVWTLVSILTYPKERKREELSYNILWGQGAVTILLLAGTVLTIKSLLA